MKGILFDLDGTILDTLKDLTVSLNYALSVSKLPERSVEEVRSFVGNGMQRLVERGIPENSSAEVYEKVYEDFAAYYTQHCTDYTKPYEGVPRLLFTLKSDGYLLATVSNKNDSQVKQLCQRYFPGIFDVVIGANSDMKKKPAPDMVYNTLTAMGIEKNNAIYIGDSEVDIETASNAGIPLIAVNWGFRTTDQLKECGAANIVSTPEELVMLVLSQRLF